MSLNKDLRVVLNVELKFEEYITLKVKKVSTTFGLIRRTCLCLDSPLFRKLIINLMRPHLDYREVIRYRI